MSVINKMLRDLDQRRATSLDPALRVGVALATGRSGASGMADRFSRRGAWGAGVLLVVTALLGAAWYWNGTVQERPVLQAAAPPVPAAEAPAPAAPLPAASAPVAPVSAAPASAGAPLPDSAVVVAPPAEPVASTPAVSVKAPGAPAGAGPGLRFSSSMLMKAQAGAGAPAGAVAAPALPAQAVSGPDPAVAAQRQQTATRDVLAQAQSLYGSGSADAAIQLLQDSLQVAERASPPASAPTQLSLVRELARMELAQGRAPAVLELLGRVEPLLSGQADLWAVRANAAQRLGRHSEAVQFYATALQTRPAEPRWLLGSAVSQAALGQLALAAELAEKARAIGPVSKEVWTYLRQQGVSLSERP